MQIVKIIDFNFASGEGFSGNFGVESDRTKNNTTTIKK